MPKKRRRGKKRLTPKQKARRAKAEKAAIKRIAKEEGITQKEARRMYKDALIEVVFERPRRYVQRRFIEISPGKFREIPEGEKILQVNATGPIRSTAYVSRIRKMKQYWELVHIISEEFDLTLEEARQQITRDKKEKSLRQILWEKTGRSV